jgi:uncharacterized protein (DUF302 family)
MTAKVAAPDTRARKPKRAPSYGRSVRLPDTPAATGLERARHAFGQEGFGVVAEIDLRDTLQRKLDKDVGPYWLLEICNPMLADRTLAVDHAAGLLLPCKVAVWQDGRDAVVAALRPEVVIDMADTEALVPIAREAEERIERALVRLDAKGI